MPCSSCACRCRRCASGAGLKAGPAGAVEPSCAGRCEPEGRVLPCSDHRYLHSFTYTDDRCIRQDVSLDKELYGKSSWQAKEQQAGRGGGRRSKKMSRLRQAENAIKGPTPCSRVAPRSSAGAGSLLATAPALHAPGPATSAWPGPCAETRSEVHAASAAASQPHALGHAGLDTRGLSAVGCTAASPHLLHLALAPHRGGRVLHPAAANELARRQEQRGGVHKKEQCQGCCSSGCLSAPFFLQAPTKTGQHAAHWCFLRGFFICSVRRHAQNHPTTDKQPQPTATHRCFLRGFLMSLRRCGVRPRFFSMSVGRGKSNKGGQLVSDADLLSLLLFRPDSQGHGGTCET